MALGCLKEMPYREASKSNNQKLDMTANVQEFRRVVTGIKYPYSFSWSLVLKIIEILSALMTKLINKRLPS